MSSATPPRGWLPDFRRALALLRPHWRPLAAGLAAALGVGLFYTVSLSSVVPLLKVMFAEHENLSDWLNRLECERRLGIVLAADVPDDRNGLLVVRVRPDGRAAGVLGDADRLTGIGDDRLSAYVLMRRIAEHTGERLDRLRVEAAEGSSREVVVALAPPGAWWGLMARGAALLPQDRSFDGRLATLALVMGALVVVSLVGGAFRFMNEGLVALAVQRAMHDLRSRLAEHVLRLPLDWHTSQPPGDTLGRFATDVSKVEVGISTLAGKTVREPLKALGVLALTAMIDWRMLLLALIGLPVAALVMRTFGRIVKRAQRRASQSWGRLIDHLGEKLAGIRIVKAYGMERDESRRFEREGRTLTRAQTHIELVDAATNPALEFLAMIAVAGFVLYGGSRVFAGQLEPHLFFAGVVCLGGVFDPVRKMGNVNNRLQQADASARRLFALLDLPVEEPGRGSCSMRADPGRARPRADADADARSFPAAADELMPRLRRAVEFRDVSFAYPSRPERLVLDRVSLTVSAGEVVALVGPNGSGKTTLMSLLLRFYEPTRGAILLDGRDLRDLPLDGLRRRIGLVTQDSVVFSDTVFGNIAYGANGVQPEEVLAAARLAHVDDFIRTLRVEENGRVRTAYEAPITARALSGGQRQRIALARAILRDPAILILDEATSQVDSESERRIQEAIEDVTRGRTTFVIAHRFSTIARADRIVVLNEGRLLACGAHDELLATCPFYVALCQTQFAQGAAP